MLLKHPDVPTSAHLIRRLDQTIPSFSPYPAMLAQCQPPVTSSGFFVNSSNMIDIPDSYAAAAAAAVANQSQYPMHFQSKPRMTSLPAGTSSTSRPSNPAMTSAPPTLSSVPSSRIQVKKQRRNVSRNVTPGSRNLSSCGKGSSDFGQRTAQACDRCKVRARSFYYIVMIAIALYLRISNH